MMISMGCLLSCRVSTIVVFTDPGKVITAAQLPLEVLGGEDFLSGSAVAIAGNSAGTIEEVELKAETAIEFDDPVRGLVRQNHRSRMAG